MLRSPYTRDFWAVGAFNLFFAYYRMANGFLKWSIGLLAHTDADACYICGALLFIIGAGFILAGD